MKKADPHGTCRSGSTPLSNLVYLIERVLTELNARRLNDEPRRILA